MKCPACRNLMIVVEHDQIELDFCPDCSGVWFDAGELELLLESMELEGTDLGLASVFNSPGVESTEKKRRCPICGKRMTKVTVGRQPEVLVDACPMRHGLWFDSGEVGQLITQLPDKTDSRGRVVGFLGEVFTARD